MEYIDVELFVYDEDCYTFLFSHKCKVAITSEQTLTLIPAKKGLPKQIEFSSELIELNEELENMHVYLCRNGSSFEVFDASDMFLELDSPLIVTIFDGEEISNAVYRTEYEDVPVSITPQNLTALALGHLLDWDISKIYEVDKDGQIYYAVYALNGKDGVFPVKLPGVEAIDTYASSLI